VVAAGGWLFDRVMAGWDVHVTLSTAGDPRPLRILGVGTGIPDADDADAGVPVALALSARVLATEQAVRGEVETALRQGRAEVTVWGDARWAGMDGGAGAVLPVRHVLSAAARTFKAHALSAAGFDAPTVAHVEDFRTGNRSSLPVPPDLMPA
jgi:hypothetical protein